MHNVEASWQKVDHLNYEKNYHAAHNPNHIWTRFKPGVNNAPIPRREFPTFHPTLHQLSLSAIWTSRAFRSVLVASGNIKGAAEAVGRRDSRQGQKVKVTQLHERTGEGWIIDDVWSMIRRALKEMSRYGQGNQGDQLSVQWEWLVNDVIGIIQSIYFHVLGSRCGLFV